MLMTESCIDLCLLALIAVGAYAIGRTLLRFVGCSMHTLAGSAAASTSLGLAIVAYEVLGLGLAGALSTRSTIATLAATWIACTVIWRLRPPTGSVDGRRRHCAGDWSRPALVALAIVAASLLGSTLVRALAPPTAGDALCYHLELPKRFVQLGSIDFLPWTEQSLFPFLMEMLYVMGLVLRGPVLAQLISWLIGVLFAMSVVELTATVAAGRGAYLAGLVALSVPAVTNHMSVPLNDLPVALFATLALVAALRSVRRGCLAWAGLSGGFAGLAASVKMTALVWDGLLAVGVTMLLWRRCRLLSLMRLVALYAAVAAITGGLWYVRSWYHTGNPVHPYFADWFGSVAEPLSGGDLKESAVPRTVWGLVQFPWAATMQPDRFGGRGHQFGVLFLALVPCVLVVRRRPHLNAALGIAGLYAVVWFTLRQNLRFFMPTLAVGCAAVALVAIECRRRPFALRMACGGMMVGSVLLGVLVAANRARPCVAVALGGESRSAYLKRCEPSFQVAEFANRALGADARIVSEDYRVFYFDRPIVRESALRRWQRYDATGANLTAHWARQGFTHLLLVRADNPATAVYDGDLRARLGPVRERMPSVFQCEFSGPDGDQRRYELLAVPSPETRIASREPATTGRALRH